MSPEGGGRGGWRPARVVDAWPETPRARTLRLEVEGWPGHRAGQHVDVRLTAADGYQAQRAYSIASAPGDSGVELTAERVEDGEVSPWLVEEARPGDRLEVRGPVGGHFVWEPRLRSPLLLVAGGSGIVPLMSMLRHRVAAGSRVPARLLYSARSPEEIIYHAELHRLALEDPALQVVYTLTRAAPAEWTGYRRRLDRAMLEAVAWPLRDAPLAFLCGPTALVETAAEELLELGWPPVRVRTERFGPSGG